MIPMILFYILRIFALLIELTIGEISIKKEKS